MAPLKNRDTIALLLVAITIQAMVLWSCPAQGYRDPHGKGTHILHLYISVLICLILHLFRNACDDKYFKTQGVIINYNEIRTVIIACCCVVQPVTVFCITDRHAIHNIVFRSARLTGLSTLTQAAAILPGARAAASSAAATGFEKRARSRFMASPINTLVGWCRHVMSTGSFYVNAL
jgi:Flp pilus assembly protein protease CpaA